jgi:DNA-dependent protein kinase catalytic subunit
MFLVKGGEDLRLDQRLQQLFTLMNEALYKVSFFFNV